MLLQLGAQTAGAPRWVLPRDGALGAARGTGAGPLGQRMPTKRAGLPAPRCSCRARGAVLRAGDPGPRQAGAGSLRSRGRRPPLPARALQGRRRPVCDPTVSLPSTRCVRAAAPGRAPPRRSLAPARPRAPSSLRGFARGGLPASDYRRFSTARGLLAALRPPSPQCPPSSTARPRSRPEAGRGAERSCPPGALMAFFIAATTFVWHGQEGALSFSLSFKVFNVYF